MDSSPEKKCVFFDRDGVVNRSPGAGYVTRPEEFHLNDGLIEVMKLVADRGFVAVLVTSQRCVGKGLISYDELELIHGKLRSKLAEEGLAFLDIYTFLGTPETVSWEKPSPEMILLATEKHGIDLPASWMIGDADRDIVMGQRAGVGKTLRIITDKEVGVEADFTTDNLSGAFEILSEHLV